MPRGGSRPGAGRPKGSTKAKTRVELGSVENADPVVGLLLSVLKSDGCSPETRVRAAEALSRHALAIRQSQERVGRRAAKRLGAPEEPYTPGPLGYLHTAGRTKEAGLEALARAIGGDDDAGDFQEYHPPAWVAMIEFLYSKRLKLSPGDQIFIDGLLARVERRPEPGPEPSTEEGERLSSIFWAAGGTAEYLASLGDA